jgi:hypothetical protein
VDNPQRSANRRVPERIVEEDVRTLSDRCERAADFRADGRQ